MRAVLHLVDTGLGLYGVLPPGSRGNHGEDRPGTQRSLFPHRRPRSQTHRPHIL
jgi:hypothetical protein